MHPSTCFPETQRFNIRASTFQHPNFKLCLSQAFASDSLYCDQVLSHLHSVLLHLLSPCCPISITASQIHHPKFKVSTSKLQSVNIRKSTLHNPKAEVSTSNINSFNIRNSKFQYSKSKVSTSGVFEASTSETQSFNIITMTKQRCHGEALATSKCTMKCKPCNATPCQLARN